MNTKHTLSFRKYTTNIYDFYSNFNLNAFFKKKNNKKLLHDVRYIFFTA